MTGRYHTLQIGSWADSVGRENVASVFAEFDCGKRTDEVDGITYLQMFRFLKRTEEAAA